MKQKIANFLNIDIEDLKEITNLQKQFLRENHSNLYQMPVFYTDEYIIFGSESAMKHWQYYVGFEYLPDPEIMKRDNDFIAAYSIYNDRDDRVQIILDELEEANNQQPE